jgi:hypothetical protein
MCNIFCCATLKDYGILTDTLLCETPVLVLLPVHL